MAKQPIGGVSGVLEGLTSGAAPELPRQDDLKKTIGRRPKSVPPQGSPKTRARLGRPPGRVSGQLPQKEKITVRIDAELAEQYRDWSWESRCQLGELVERALRDYRQRNTKR